MRIALLAFVSLACRNAPEPAARPPAGPPASGWRCFVADPATPRIAAGNVTHLKERLLPDRYEVENVNLRDGVFAASRFVYRKVGDHFEAPMGKGTLVLRMHDARGTRQSLSYEDKDGWKFSEETVIDERGMTNTSTDYDADGKPHQTVTRHLNAPCTVVDAELAKYPP